MKSLLFILVSLSISLHVTPQVLKSDEGLYMKIQVELQGKLVHEDGSDVYLFSGYIIKNEHGKTVLKVPEATNLPHTISILQGTYSIEYYKDGTPVEVKIEIGNDCFQKFSVN